MTSVVFSSLAVSFPPRFTRTSVPRAISASPIVMPIVSKLPVDSSGLAPASWPSSGTATKRSGAVNMPMWLLSGSSPSACTEWVDASGI